jgi:hypothetical protein
MGTRVRKHKTLTEQDFKKVLEAVQKGSNYTEALKTIKWSAPTFKKRITEEQRLELRKYFASNLAKKNKGRGLKVLTKKDFEKVLFLVRDGLPYYKAVKTIGWSEQGFRNRMTEKQKLEYQNALGVINKRTNTPKKISNLEFQKVVSLVEENISVMDAVKVIGWNRNIFHKAMTEKQKLELRMVSTANALYGIGSQFKKDFKK